MRCESETERLAFVEGTLPLDERLAIEQHLESCAHCTISFSPIGPIWPKAEGRAAGRLETVALRELVLPAPE